MLHFKLVSLVMIILVGLVACSPLATNPPPTIAPTAVVAATTPTRPPPPTATPIPLPSPTPTLTPFPVATATAAPSVTPLRPRAEVQVNALNVREGPGVAYPIVDSVARGQILRVTGTNPASDWLQIVTPTENPGWVSAQHVTLRGLTPDALPIVEPPLLPVSAAPASQPAAPVTRLASGGRLVFATRSGGDLYRINADGTHLEQLAPGVIDPVASPDGRYIAFTRWDGAEMGTLYTLDLQSGTERIVQQGTLQAKSPTWSPDGTHIMVSFQHGGLRDPKEDCRKYDLDDGVRFPRGPGEITDITVGPSGTRICFIPKEDLLWRLRHIEVVTGNFSDLGTDHYSYNPTWDPQQPWRVIFDGTRGLLQLDVTTELETPLTDDVRDTGPVFAPDGSQIALTYRQHDHWEVYTLNPASGERRRLTKPPLLAEPQYSSAAPAWSPDGTQLAFITNRRGPWEIWVMAADGSNPRPLFDPALQAELNLAYFGVNERLLNWLP